VTTSQVHLNVRFGARRNAHPARRLVLRATAVVLALLVVAYFAISYYAVATITTDYPRASVERAPNVPAPTYENVAFATPDGLTLRGWFFPVAPDRVVALIPGREDDRTWGGRYERIAGDLIAAGYSVLMFDMRGHGSSDGAKRYTMGYFERNDVAGAIDFLVARGFPESRIGLLGISMGAATELATLPLRPAVGPMIVESAYSDLETLIAEDLPRHYNMPALLAPGISVAARIGFGIVVSEMRPIEVVRAHPERAFFFIQCEDDDYVLPHHATDLRAASANSASELWMVPGCGHVDASQVRPDEYRSRVLAFLAREFASGR
jgi:pimeloyl-ACP methyl ester carboxylesterase